MDRVAEFNESLDGIENTNVFYNKPIYVYVVYRQGLKIMKRYLNCIVMFGIFDNNTLILCYDSFLIFVSWYTAESIVCVLYFRLSSSVHLRLRIYHTLKEAQYWQGIWNCFHCSSWFFLAWSVELSTQVTWPSMLLFLLLANLHLFLWICNSFSQFMTQILC